MAKLPKEIRVRTDTLPPEVQDWMLNQMDRYRKKASVFFKDFLIRYYDDHVVQKARKVEIVGSQFEMPQPRQKTPITPPENAINGGMGFTLSSSQPGIDANNEEFDENNTTTENFF